MSIGKVHDRILDEIKDVKADKQMKDFLKIILEFELDILDKGRPVFKPDYDRMLNETFFK